MKINRYFFISLLLTIIILSVSLFSFTIDNNQEQKSRSFKLGEYFHYEVEFSFMDLAEGEIQFQDEKKLINGVETYQIIVKGWTKGMMSWFAKINNTWGAYVETKSLKPIRSYRFLQENKYRLDEIVDYDYDAMKITNKSKGTDDVDYRDPKTFDMEKIYYDLFSGYLHIREKNMDAMHVGDTLTVPAFFEDTFYDFKMLYAGKEVIKIDFGKIECHKITPIMPDNKLFAGENAISAWFSADKNKIPVKVQANMFIGKANVTIDKFKNLKHPLKMKFE